MSSRRPERRSDDDIDSVPVTLKDTGMNYTTGANWFRLFEGVIFLIVSIVGFILYSTQENVKDFTFQLSRLDAEVHRTEFKDDSYNWVHPVTVADGAWSGGLVNAVVPLLISLGCGVDFMSSYLMGATSTKRRSVIRWFMESLTQPLLAVTIFIQFGEFSTFSLLGLFGLVHTTTLMGLFLETSNPQGSSGVNWWPLVFSLWLPVFSLVPVIVLLAQAQSVDYILWSTWIAAATYVVGNAIATFTQAGYYMYRADPQRGFWPYSTKASGTDNFTTYEKTLSLNGTVTKLLILTFLFVSSNDDSFWIYPQAVTTYASYEECGGLEYTITQAGDQLKVTNGVSAGCPFDVMEINSYTPGGFEGVSTLSSVRSGMGVEYTGDNSQPTSVSRSDACDQDDSTRNALTCYYPPTPDDLATWDPIANDLGSAGTWGRYDSAKCGCGVSTESLNDYYTNLALASTARCLAVAPTAEWCQSPTAAILLTVTPDVVLPCTCFDLSIKSTTLSQMRVASNDNGELTNDRAAVITRELLIPYLSSISGIVGSIQALNLTQEALDDPPGHFLSAAFDFDERDEFWSWLEDDVLKDGYPELPETLSRRLQSAAKSAVPHKDKKSAVFTDKETVRRRIDGLVNKRLNA